MSVQRDELLRLVEELPEEEVPAVLDDVPSLAGGQGAAVASGLVRNRGGLGR